MLDEFLMQLDIQLIKRFQTIGNEPGGHHHHMFDAFFGQPDNALIRIGLQPWLRPEPRLERCVKTGLIPAKLLAQQARRFQTLAMIGIARHMIAFRHAME